MRALIVAYYFPPKGGAGTQRFAKFCKFLPAHGVEPIVLTADEALRSDHAPTDDVSLLREATCEVVRVPAPTRVPAALRWRRRLRLQIDEDEWAWAASDHAVATARERQVDVCLTTLSPYACHRLGERVRQELGIPWIVDLRDPWALDAWRSYPTALHARLDLQRMRRVLQSADFVIANVPEARRAFVRLGADPERTVVIPNGFDEEDFAACAPPAPSPPASPAPRQFRLVHMGTFHAVDVAPGLTSNHLLRVRHRQIEPLGRTGYYLLHALAQWAQANPEHRQQMSVQFYGRADASHQRLIDELGLGDLVTNRGYVPHGESIAALCAADAVFVPLHGLAVAERALVVPGKLYEALASERPVLAAMPPGDGASLVHALKAGLVVPATDAEALTTALGTMFDSWRSGEPLPGCSRERLAPFSRRRLTALLAQVFDAAARRSGAVQVVDPWQSLGIR